MTEKPMMIPPSVKSPDYGSFLKRTLSKSTPREHPFARTIAEQEAAVRQNSVISPHASLPGQSGSGTGETLGPSSRLATLSSLQQSFSERLGEQQSLAPEPAQFQGMPQNSTHEADPTPDQTAEELAGLPTGQSGTYIRGKLDTNAIAMPVRNAPGGMVLRQAGGGINLDDRALSTLRRVGQSLGVRTHVRKRKEEGDGDLGCLSARYESGDKGSAAIGYDRNGGTSYGKYQISSRQGTFNQFLSFLSDQAPDLAERLRKAGKPNTGGAGGAVPDEWRAIAEEQTERFDTLQENFIRDSHYNPALEAVRDSLGVDQLSTPLQEVLWSTAVQHGPVGAQRIFDRAAQQLAAKGKDPSDERALIETVYSLRKGQFASSTPTVQAAVRQRFDDERRQALAMVQKGTVALA